MPSSDSEELVVGIHDRGTVFNQRESRRASGRALAHTHRYDQEEFAAGLSEVSNKPVETFVYLTLRHNASCMVITPDESVWWIEHGKIDKDKRNASKIKS